MSTSTTHFIKFWSWLSLTAPFVALVVCFIESLGVTDFLWPEDMFPSRRIYLVWSYSFFASGFVGLLALIGSLAVREKWCIWRSVAGLVLSGLVAKVAVLMTYIQ
jgi:hypothetical protein